jgi:hypothetical protein
MQVDVAPARQLGFLPGQRPYRTSFALLPDGRAVVFEGHGDKGPQLYSRSLDRWEAVPIPGTEGGSAPFLSPDGRWIGFYADNTIKKVQVGGGTAAAICEYRDPWAAIAPYGTSWGAGDTVVFADNSRLLRVPATGGKPEVLLVPDRAKGEEAHRLPHFLPGGRTLVFTTQTSASMWTNPRVELLSLETGARKVVLAEGADARYSTSGHLVFMRQGTLCAAPFDLARLEVTAGLLRVLLPGGAGPSLRRRPERPPADHGTLLRWPAGVEARFPRCLDDLLGRLPRRSGAPGAVAERRPRAPARARTGPAPAPDPHDPDQHRRELVRRAQPPRPRRQVSAAGPIRHSAGFSPGGQSLPRSRPPSPCQSRGPRHISWRNPGVLCDIPSKGTA